MADAIQKKLKLELEKYTQLQKGVVPSMLMLMCMLLCVANPGMTSIQ